ncbi:hypothetical protein ANCDUO_08337 [Ancylostoma duodenale]|uniref:Protein kinase domain-containing protein n=1 Tax=Ancylostoma duodenale TaxID=51022 RepID=A0A0C2GWC7_9BILA|nr:hypothetical protein ANCDUO_08337 [Ancylostoma duodenale]
MHCREPLAKGTGEMSKAKIKEMMREARLIRNFKHKNIVRLYGVAVDEQPLYILLELVKGKKVAESPSIKCLGSARRHFKLAD